MENILGERNRKTIFSAIQPSGSITLGNYLGAIKNWVSLQNDADCIFSVADLHSITVRQDPEQLRRNTLEAYALLISCGIDIEKSIFFIQSHVSTHAELAWILNCYTQFGELSRMTQFKDKSKKHSDNINSGLFTYPSLMAADIILYQTDAVPVGADQKQHVELTRNIAERFNSIYGQTFKIPEPFIASSNAKVMSLQDPSKKMSKSDKNENAWIGILDSKDNIIKKFKRAVTDSESCVCYKEGKDGINNLIEIYSAVTGKSYDQIEKEFDLKGYGEFKLAVAESVADALEPIKENFKRLINDKTYLENCYKISAKKAYEISNQTLSDVKNKIGFIF